MLNLSHITKKSNIEISSLVQSSRIINLSHINQSNEGNDRESDIVNDSQDSNNSYDSDEEINEESKSKPRRIRPNSDFFHRYIGNIERSNKNCTLNKSDESPPIISQIAFENDQDIAIEKITQLAMMHNLSVIITKRPFALSDLDDCTSDYVVVKKDITSSNIESLINTNKTKATTKNIKILEKNVIPEKTAIKSNSKVTSDVLVSMPVKDIYSDNPANTKTKLNIMTGTNISKSDAVIMLPSRSSVVTNTSDKVCMIQLTSSKPINTGANNNNKSDNKNNKSDKSENKNNKSDNNGNGSASGNSTGSVSTNSVSAPPTAIATTSSSVISVAPSSCTSKNMISLKPTRTSSLVDKSTVSKGMKTMISLKHISGTNLANTTGNISIATPKDIRDVSGVHVPKNTSSTANVASTVNTAVTARTVDVVQNKSVVSCNGIPTTSSPRGSKRSITETTNISVNAEEGDDVISNDVECAVEGKRSKMIMLNVNKSNKNNVDGKNISGTSNNNIKSIKSSSMSIFHKACKSLSGIK